MCAALRGDVIEIGFGTGLNLPHLPPGVEVLRAVDPLERGRVLASERIATSAVPVEFVGLDGQSLPLDDDSIDAALSTWTLCSIPDPIAGPASTQVAEASDPRAASSCLRLHS